MPANPCIYWGCGYFIRCSNLVDHFARTYKVTSYLLNDNINIEKFFNIGVTDAWKVIFSNVYKQGKIVHFMAQIYTTSTTVSNAEYTVFILPKEIRPLYNYALTATASNVNGNNACACYSNVNINGGLTVKIPNNTCKHVVFNGTWFTI